MHDWYVIFGARVLRDGTPSGALKRRVDAAIVASRQSASPMFLPTGGRGSSSHIEAAIMRSLLLAAGISPGQIVCENGSRNTIASVCNCAGVLRARNDVARVFVCSDDYHQRRCRFLLRMCGIESEPIRINSAAKSNSWLNYAYMVIREVVAIPVDGSIMALRKIVRRT